MSELGAIARTVLVADDDARLRERLVRAFIDRGHDARGACDVDEARSLAAEESPEWAVVDLRMPGASGLDLVRELVSIDPATRVVVLTGYGSIATAIEAVKAGAADYLTKPADADQIIAALEGTTKRRANASNRRMSRAPSRGRRRPIRQRVVDSSLRLLHLEHRAAC